MSWLLVFLILTSGSIDGLLSEAAPPHHHRKSIPSAIIVGTVYCDTCFQDDFSHSSHLISGASVAVECRYGVPNKGVRQEVKTDERGEFRFLLPPSVSKHLNRIKNCSVMLLSSPQPYCAVASSATSTSLRLRSNHKGTHVFSAGFFTFTPENQPEICSHKPIRSQKTDFSDPSFPPPLQDPVPSPAIPDLPQLPPLPSLPPLPPLPGLPLTPPGKPPKPKHSETVTDQKQVKTDEKPGNPLQPPSVPAPNLPNLPPAPLIPSLPPLPPLPLTPPSVPSDPVPPVPIIPGNPPPPKKPSP